MKKVVIFIATFVLTLSLYSADLNRIADLINSQDFSKALKEVKSTKNITGTVEPGTTLLHYAVGFGATDLVKELIKKGADINALDIDGNTPLMVAAIVKNIDMIDLLRENGARNDIVNKNGGTAFHIIYEVTDDMSLFEKVDARSDFYEALSLSPAQIYARTGRLKELKSILEKTNDYEQPFIENSDFFSNNEGKTLFWYAALNNQIDVMKYLLSKKVNTFAKVGNEDIFEVLLRNLDRFRPVTDFMLKNKVPVADVNGRANNGMTYLMIAAMNKDISTVKYLVENGADVNITDNSNEKKTALKYATLYSSESENQEVVNYLKSKNAK